MSLFLADGCVEIDSNTVERSIRPLALTRKNALFAGSDGGAEHWAVIASLIETAKLNSVEPHAYLADVMTRIVSGHPNSRIDELLPWAYPAQAALRDVACDVAPYLPSFITGLCSGCGPFWTGLQTRSG